MSTRFGSEDEHDRRLDLVGVCAALLLRGARSDWSQQGDDVGMAEDDCFLRELGGGWLQSSHRRHAGIQGIESTWPVLSRIERHDVDG